MTLAGKASTLGGRNLEMDRECSPMSTALSAASLAVPVVERLVRLYVKLRARTPVRKVLGHLADPAKSAVAIIKELDAPNETKAHLDLSHHIDWSAGMPRVRPIYWGNILSKWSTGDAHCLLAVKELCSSLLSSASLSIAGEDDRALKDKDVVLCPGGNAVSHDLLRSLWPEVVALRTGRSYAHDGTRGHRETDLFYFKGVNLLLDSIQMRRSSQSRPEYGIEFAVVLKRSRGGVEHWLFVGHGSRATAASGHWFARHCSEIRRCYGRADFALLLACDTALEHVGAELVKAFPSPARCGKRMHLFRDPCLYEDGVDHPRIRKFREILMEVAQMCSERDCQEFPSSQFLDAD